VNFQPSWSDRIDVKRDANGNAFLRPGRPAIDIDSGRQWRETDLQFLRGGPVAAPPQRTMRAGTAPALRDPQLQIHTGVTAMAP